MSVTKTHAWADNFGEWHVRVFHSHETDVGDIVNAAFSALEYEIGSRDSVADLCALSLDLVEEAVGSTVFVERWPSDSL